MPRVVPSQVVQFIDQLPMEHPTGTLLMNSIGPAALSCVLDLVELVPNELLTMDTTTYATFVHAKAQMKEVLATWRANQNANQHLQNFSFSKATNPLARIRDALAKCPDESPAPSTSELNFITDTALRTNLRNDMGAINRALSNGEWKAATVLAGSAIEALLLWGLQSRHAADIPAAVAALLANKTFTNKPPSSPEEWTLYHYIEAAAYLRLINPDTATAARLAKEFRNLIHPGRAQRLAQNCDRGTALSCVAGLELVVRDLT
jgi:hypothetical protein